MPIYEECGTCFLLPYKKKVKVHSVLIWLNITELQIRGGTEENSKFFIFLNENIHCDLSLEPSR